MLSGMPAAWDLPSAQPMTLSGFTSGYVKKTFAQASADLVRQPYKFGVVAAQKCAIYLSI